LPNGLFRPDLNGHSSPFLLAFFRRANIDQVNFSSLPSSAERRKKITSSGSQCSWEIMNVDHSLSMHIVIRRFGNLNTTIPLRTAKISLPLARTFFLPNLILSFRMAIDRCRFNPMMIEACELVRTVHEKFSGSTSQNHSTFL